MELISTNIEPINDANINLPGDIVISQSGKILKRYFEYRGYISSILDNYNYWIIHIIPNQLNNFRINVGNGYTIRVSNPHFIKPETVVKGKKVEFTPAMARRQFSTYSAELKVQLELRDGNDNVVQTIYNFSFGRIPIMLRSKICHLYGKSEEELALMEECPKDPFGYFIINGIEKMIVIHEKLRTNRFFLFNRNNEGDPVCKITCKSNLGTRNVILFNSNVGSIRIIQNSFGKDNSISLFTVYQYLMGNIDEEGNVINYDIVDYDNLFSIIAIFTDKSNYNKFREKLYTTYIDYYVNIEKDKTFLSTKAKSNNIEDIQRYLRKELFYHMEDMGKESDANRIYLLSLMTARYIEYLIGVRKLDDRDNWGNKALVTAGNDMEALFGRILTKICNSAESKIAEYVKSKGININLNSLVNFIHTNIITTEFESSFRNTYWGISGDTRKENIVEMLKREGSLLSIYSQLTKVKTPTSKQSRQPSIREIQMSQLGYIDIVESPEGENCGLVKHLAVTCFITYQQDDSIILQLINDDIHTTYDDETYQCLIVNGKFIGWVDKSIRDKLIRFRRERKIYEYTCIVSDGNILYVYTDAGRPVRPLLIVENNIPLIYTKHLTEMGFDILLSSGVVEYIDAWEQQNITIMNGILTDETTYMKRYNDELVGKAIYDVYKQKYTHSELDPNAILGYSASLIPLINYNQGPRNTFQCNMGKQALGIYNSSYLTRFDNMVKLLMFPQQSLLQTQMAKWIGMNDLPAGEMVIVAFMTYSGFNQEDAIIFNKASIDMGKFKMIVYHRYTTTFITNKQFSEKLAKPKPLPNQPIDKYRHLDNNGIAVLGSYVREGDVVIGKARIYSDGNIDYSGSVTVGIGEEGVVDRVLVTTNTDSNSVVIVRVREVRNPIIGDKFASRYAQKSTIGLIVPREDMPFTLNGIIPDILINPHCIPSRMTMGKLLEIVASKVAALKGEFINGTGFNDFKLDQFQTYLRQHGYSDSGEETMIDGRTGELYKSRIMIGPCYYQALRHHVKDKYFSRGSRGKIRALTRAPIGKRQVGGALRVGEMERDVFINHGAAGVIMDRFCLSSDAYRSVFCRTCGRLAWLDVKKGEYVCIRCKEKQELGQCVIPYIFKVIVDYLAGAGISVRVNFKKVEEVNTELQPYYEYENSVLPVYE